MKGSISKSLLAYILTFALVINLLPQLSLVSASANTQDSFDLYYNQVVSDIYVDSDDYSQVNRAVSDLKADIKTVTDSTPEIVSDIAQLSSNAIIVGTIGHSSLIDTLIEQDKIDASGIVGQWEGFIISVIDNPISNVDKALVIAGSDKRGTIYGIYELSQFIGVSPWYWWGDVSIPKKTSVQLLKSEIETQQIPDVKYRGIFINDEENLQQWSKVFENNTDSQGSPNSKTYEKVFELMLRLKANILWPAMHQQSTAFNAIINPNTGNSYNAETADRYGIIMGASHCEMLLRNNETEWEPWCEANKTKYNIKKVNNNWKDGYDYTVNPEAMNAYWEERVAANYKFENVYTIGLRAVHDSGINCSNLADKSYQSKAGVVRQAVEAQVEILEKYEKKYKEETGIDVSFPKLFCPYKEASKYYEYDLSLPEDTMIVWSDDNHGYVRQQPTQEELEQYAGSGVYYHVSYYDADRVQSYLWVASTPLSLIYEEMNKSYHAGSDDFWILNVGDIKPAEIPTEFFLEMGWDIDKYSDSNINEFIAEVAKRDFGLDDTQSERLYNILTEYYQINIAKRPEYQCNKVGSEYSLIDYGDEAQIQINKMKALCKASEEIYNSLSNEVKPSYWQMVHYMLRASKLSFEKSVYQQKNQLYVKQDRFASVNAYAKASLDAYNQILDDLKYFNKELSGGKWDGIINPYNTTQGLPVIAGEPSPITWVSEEYAVDGIGSVCEGQTYGTENTTLKFNSISDNSYYIDVFNKGTKAVSYKVKANDYVVVSNSDGEIWNGTTDNAMTVYSDEVEVEKRFWISIDWTKVVEGTIDTVVVVTDDFGFEKEYKLNIVKSSVNPQSELTLGNKGHYEVNGEVSIEAEHYSDSVANGGQEWKIVKNLGRSGDSMKCYPDLSATATRIDSNFETTSPYLEYKIYFNTTGTYKGSFYRLPTLNEGANKTCRTGIQFDNGEVGLLRGNSLVDSGTWSGGVRNQVEEMEIPISINVTTVGWHTLRVYKSDAGIVFDKIVLKNNSVSIKASHLGAPESFNTNTVYTKPLKSTIPNFLQEEITYPESSDVKKYLFDFTSNASSVAAGYSGIDVTTQKSSNKGYEWDQQTFSNVSAVLRTGLAKVSTRDTSFVYGTKNAKLKIKVLESGSYIVAVAVGDRQAGGYSANNMSVVANGKKVIENLNVDSGRTIEKSFVIEVGKDKTLDLEFSGNKWIVSAIEIGKYKENATNNPYYFRADSSGSINIEAEAVYEQSDYAYSTASTDNLNSQWTQTYGESGSAMISGPNMDYSYSQTDATANRGPRMNYKILVEKTGSYYMWVLVKSQCADDDSILVSVDGKTPVVLNDTKDTQGCFVWYRVSSFSFNTLGEHTISVWEREDGISLDKIILSKSALTPVGLGGEMYRKEDIELSKPTVKISKSGISSAIISWDKVDKAEEYEVYRAINSTTNFVKLAKTSSLNYTDNTIKLGSKYYYKVRAVKKDVYSEFSNNVLVEYNLSAVKGLKVVAKNYNTINASWEKVPGATGYYVFVSKSKNGSYTRCSTKATSYSKSSLSTGKTYYVKIQPYTVVDGKVISGSVSSLSSAKLKLAVPKNIKAVKGSFKWQKVSGANGYDVYYATKKNGKYKKLGSVKATKIKNKKLKKGKKYFVKVRAYRKVSGKKVYSRYSVAKKLKVK